MGRWFSVGPAMLSRVKGRRIMEDLPFAWGLPETDGPCTMNGSSPYKPWEASTIASICYSQMEREPFEPSRHLIVLPLQQSTLTR